MYKKNGKNQNLVNRQKIAVVFVFRHTLEQVSSISPLALFACKLIALVVYKDKTKNGFENMRQSSSYKTLKFAVTASWEVNNDILIFAKELVMCHYKQSFGVEFVK